MNEKQILEEIEYLAQNEELEKQRKKEILYSKYGDFIDIVGTSVTQQLIKMIEEEIENVYIKEKNNLMGVPDDVLIKEKYFLLGMKQALELVKDLCNPIHYSQADKS